MLEGFGASLSCERQDPRQQGRPGTRDQQNVLAVGFNTSEVRQPSPAEHPRTSQVSMSEGSVQAFMVYLLGEDTQEK
jgi:hypothetical protein